MKITGASLVLLTWFTATAVAAPIEHTLRSDVTAHTTHVRVDLPASYDLQDSHSYPVLYVLDGETNGESARAVVHYLSEIGRAPEMIVVAVAAGPTRARDYLPASEAAKAQGGGSADAFLRFFVEELAPFVQETYRAAPLRVITGHSYGGLFVLHAMASRPDFFAGALVQSPYVDPELAAPVFGAWDAEGSTASGYVFACLGEEPQLSAGFERLGRSLTSASDDDFHAETTIMTDETHMTTRMLGLYEGLERMFGDAWDVEVSALVADGVAALDERMATLSEAHGYPALLAPANFQRAVQLGFARGDVAAASTAAQRYVEHYPRSVTAHFLAANAAAASGDRQAALAAVDEALRLYEADPRPQWSAMFPRLEQLQARLGES